MTPQQEEAIKKIDEEFEAHRNDYGFEFMNNVIIEFISAHPEQAEKFLQEKKTMQNAMKDVIDAAKKHQTKLFGVNCGMISDEEAKQIVLAHFGVKEEPIRRNSVQTLPVPKPVKAENVAEEEPATKKLELDLDDLLGGL